MRAEVELALLCRDLDSGVSDLEDLQMNFTGCWDDALIWKLASCPALTEEQNEGICLTSR